MTTWVQNPEGGRERGPRGVARAWVEVLVRPRRFFRNGVAPGDQAPGLVFAVAVAVAYAAGLFAFVPGRLPALGGGPAVSAFVGLAFVALLVAPAVLHLTAALQTVLLIALVRDRGGVSETVQVLAYAAAPCVVAGLPVTGLRVACTAYGAALLVVGIAEVHGTTLPRAAAAAALPAALVFGYGFGGFGALEALLRTAGVL
ncbi:YIP1 family protein [Halopelagius fulvigenes]|uniref:YIP1 family protein n=1 Tax=Halopelagius fulvigenes TaxID=1198324 RepID=A0ABD5TWC2_9EURY